MNEKALAIPKEEMKEKVKALAKENFKKGPNCAESVYLALIEAGLVDLAPETVALATPFGGGMGLSRGVCGALVAAIMGVGAVHGRSQPIQGSMQEIIDKLYGNPGLYRFFNQMPHAFEEKFGSTRCAILKRVLHNSKNLKNFKRVIFTTAIYQAVDCHYKASDELL
jgi:C_GCAxxG_C_C family probable redox protein